MSDVSAAINKHLGLWWTKETSAAIEAEYGTETRISARQVFLAAVDHPLNQWEPHQAAIRQVMESLARNYPFLDDGAIRRLAGCFACATG